MVLVTKYTSQLTSDLFDPTYPGAHLSLDKRHSLAPRWVSPRLTLFAFPKAFLSRPDAPYSKPYKPQPYPEPPRCPEQRSVDMSMQVILFNSRVVLRPTVRTKIKRRLKEAVRLIVTRGAAVEESRRGPKIVFHAEDIGADKWIVPGMYVCTRVTLHFTGGFAYESRADWTYMALPTTEMLRMPFTEQIDTIRKALRFFHRRIP